jgi:hypothetical protein
VAPVLVGDFQRRGVDARAGVVDEDVDSAEPLERRVEDVDHVVGDRDVGGREGGRCLALGEGLADGAAALGVTAGQHDTGPGVGQRLGESRSEASCPAGDDGDPAFEVETVHSCHVTLRA